MRAAGAIASPSGLLPFGHAGWGYRSRGEFLAAAAAYIADGLRQNQRVVYVGDGRPDELLAELLTQPLLTGLSVPERVEVLSAADYYTFLPGTDTLDPDASLAMYLSAVGDAIANGHTGFRAVVDVTPVARTPQQRTTLAELEVRVDREMAVRPFSALCAYDIGELGEAAAELVCLHPYVSRDTVGFQLFADTTDDIDVVLTGEIDAATDDVFTKTWHRVWPTLPRAKARVDARRLRFIGHRQLITIDRQAREDDREVVLHTTEAAPARLVDVLGLARIGVEPPPGGSIDDQTLPGLREEVWFGDGEPPRRPVVDEVKRRLMLGFDIDETQAFAVLVRYARNTGTRLRDVAPRLHDELSDDAAAPVRAAALHRLQRIRDGLTSRR